MGSTASQLANALASCSRESYGTRCLPSLFADEMPAHQVVVFSFWLDRNEVTVGEYLNCVRRGLCEKRPTSPEIQRRERRNHPVSRVSWFDARDYCRSLGARLPTEAEFERAARGLTGRRFPWGHLFNRRVVNVGRYGWVKTDTTDGYQRVAPVGSFPSGATTEGILDLAGNVSEWVSDDYRPYIELEAAADSAGPRTGKSLVRAIRGGSYRSARAWVRGSSRDFAPPAHRGEDTGFRCARSGGGEMPGAERRSVQNY